MKLYINVTTQEAIRHGLKEAGKLPIEVDLAVLDQVDRDILAEMAGSHHNDPPTVSWRGTPDWAGVLIAIGLKKAELAKETEERQAHAALAARVLADGLPANIDDYAYVQGVWVKRLMEVSPEFAAAIKDERKRRDEAAYEAAVAAALALTDDELAHTSIGYYDRIGSLPWNAIAGDPRVKPRLQQRQQAIDAAAAAEKAEATALRAAAEKAEADQIATWLAEYGTKNQQERAAAEMLPREEVLEMIEAHAFGWSGPFSRYIPLKKGDVEHTQDYCEGVIHYESWAAPEATAEEWHMMERVKTLAPGAVVELRVHRGQCQEDHCEGVAYRHGIRVTIQVGAFKFSREYAAAD